MIQYIQKITDNRSWLWLHNQRITMTFATYKENTVLLPNVRLNSQSILRILQDFLIASLSYLLIHRLFFQWRMQKNYNLDKIPVTTSSWTELENVRTYFEFFKKHRNEFVDCWYPVYVLIKIYYKTEIRNLSAGNKAWYKQKICHISYVKDHTYSQRADEMSVISSALSFSECTE